MKNRNLKHIAKILLNFSISFYVFQSSVFAQKIVLPRVVGNDVLIGETVLTSISKQIPDFKIFEISSFTKEVIGLKVIPPMAVASDFNVDGLRDIALYGYSKKKNKIYVIAAISDKSKRSYRIFKLIEDSYTPELLKSNSMYLNLRTKEPAVGVTRDMIQIETFSKGVGSVVAYYFSISRKNMVRHTGEMD